MSKNNKKHRSLLTTRMLPRPSHPSSKSLKAVTHMGRCHLKPPRMSSFHAQLLSSCCWKKRGWIFFFKPRVKSLIIRLTNERSWYQIASRAQQYRGHYMTPSEQCILFSDKSIQITIHAHCLISIKWVVPDN